MSDTTPPVFVSAAVSGGGYELVLTYADVSDLVSGTAYGFMLGRAAPSAFAVVSGGAANAVTAVTVNGGAKTVTLTLTRGITSGLAVTVAYTDPNPDNDWAATQDTAGNDAASFAAATVTNNSTLPPLPVPDTTPPVFVAAAVGANGSQLVLTYADAGDLMVLTGSDALFGTRTAASQDFSVISGGSTNAVTAVTVNPSAKTVTLTLTRAVTSGLAVTVAYTDPTSFNDWAATQDAAGNDAASFAATSVTNNSTVAGPDTTPPVLASAAVNSTGTQLVLTYTDASDLFSGLAVAFSPFGTGNAAPKDFAVVSGDSFNLVTAVAVNPGAKTVTLTLYRAVTSGLAVTVAYTDPTSGNDPASTQDAAGNDAASFAATSVTNNSTLTGPDTTPPVFVSAAVNGNQLVLTYTDVSDLTSDSGGFFGPSSAAPSAFSVVSGGAANAVMSVIVNPAAKTVTLTLTSWVTHGQAVTVAYYDPTSNNDLSATQDVAGNDAASFSPTSVTNQTAASATAPAPAPAPAQSGFTVDPVTGAITILNIVESAPPLFVSANVNGRYLILSYTDSNVLDGRNAPAPEAFTVIGGGAFIPVSQVGMHSANKTIILTLATAVTQGQAVTVAYTDPTAGDDAKATQDWRGNDAASLPATAVTNATGIGPTIVPAGGILVQAQPGGALTPGGNGSDVLLGAPGNNRFFGGLGDDSITGSTGIDTAVFAGNRSSYTINAGPQGTTVSAPSSTSTLAGAGEGTDTLNGVERLAFADGSKAFDFTGSALFTAELMGVVLGPGSLQNQALVGALISYFDQGRTLAQAAELLTAGGVMAALAGGSDNTSFVNYLYRTLVGSQPSAGTSATLAGLLDGGALTQAQFLVKIAELPLNLANVNLVGLQTTGLDFLPM